jgi:AraC-like DNA-binding protein
VTDVRPIIGHVVACVETPQQRAQLVDALRGHATLRIVAIDEVVASMTATIASPNVVLLSDGLAIAGLVERTVKRIASGWPRTAIVVWTADSGSGVVDLRSLTAAGVHKFLLGARVSPFSVRAALAEAWQTNAAEQVLLRLQKTFSAELSPIIEQILESPASMTTIRALADAMGIHRRTLFNRCARAGLHPTDVLGWTRIALVAYHLENTGCTVETIALDLGYPSSATLRNTIKRYTGYRATELRAQGAMVTTITRLRDQLSA